MNCKNCGAYAANGSKFCPSCGAALVDVSSKNRKQINVREADLENPKKESLPPLPTTNHGGRVAVRIFFTVLCFLSLVLTIVLVYAYKKELDLSAYKFVESTENVNIVTRFFNFFVPYGNAFLSFLTNPIDQLGGEGLDSYFGAAYFCTGGALITIASFFLNIFDLVKTKGTAKFCSLILFVVNGVMSLAIVYIGVKLIGVDIIKYAFETLITGGSV